MNEEEARKQIHALKGFHGHLLIFIVVMIGLAVANIFSYIRGNPEIWVVLPFVFWGGWVFLHYLGAYGAPNLKKWEAEKFRELTGWSASGDELSNLAARVDILLNIVSASDAKAGNIDLAEARKTLEDVKRTIEFYQSPMDRDGKHTIEKDKVIHLVERLEALVTSREFRQMDADLNS